LPGQRWETVSANFQLDAEPTRLHDGFVFFEGNPQPDFAWLVGTEGDEWREIETSARFFPHLPPVAAGSARRPQLLLFNRQSADLDDQLLAQAVRADGSAVAPLAPVLSTFDRGSAAYPTATALDGERVGVGNGHVATRDPHFVMLDKDARPVTEEIRLLDTADGPLFDCFTLTGTAHGLLASVVDRDSLALHLLELDASGARVNDATMPVMDGYCPRVSVDPTGNYLSFQEGLALTDEGPSSVFRLADNALTEIATLPSSPEGTRYTWLVGGNEPLIGVFELSSPDRRVSFARLKAGGLVPLAGAPFHGTRVPSADGRIFLVLDESVAAVGPSTSGETKFTITEVLCGAAE